ncbi:MAG: hypothetical protein K8J09_19755 [Planctomycetes bacterium]|nr:hypothetical protein [Planctomycetota bacterium]
MSDVKHPQLDNFRRLIDSRSVAKTQADAFNTWRRGAKCAEGTPLRAAADALWARYEALPEEARRGPSLTREPAGRPGGGSRPRSTGAGQGRGPAQPRGDNRDAADPSILGAPFHNPYTFLPFPKQAPIRRRPTPLTIDEDPAERSRHTGVLQLKVRTLSPLLTCSPNPARVVQVGGNKAEHRIYSALRIGDDPIVPATGIRGALRNLLTILTGGTLGYLDESLWLTQGRDLSLGPRAEKNPNPAQPQRAFLGRVERPGSATRDGTLRLGETRLVKAVDLENVLDPQELSSLRPTASRATARCFVDEHLTAADCRESARTPWELKLSGRPINPKGKREAIFRPGSVTITIPSKLWADYLGRHAHGAIDGVKTGDLLWLEPAHLDLNAIKDAKDIRSLQWSRWGRRGESMAEVIKRHHRHFLPDNLNPDGQVDEVTDLFGQVPLIDGAAGPVSSRVRPENLVFEGVKLDAPVALAPLAAPHPGCAAFYRDSDDLDLLANRGLPLRGYKVYRTTKERGALAPWRFENQGVYNEQGAVKPSRQLLNKSAELVPEGADGVLRISFRGLTQRELALLLMTCCVDWRLGGGKPLGLGHCRVTSARVIEETGGEVMTFEPTGKGLTDLPSELRREVSQFEERILLWMASQQPVERLSYPRAVEDNNNRKQRGGHAWFHRHANPRKGGRDDQPSGLEVLWVDGELRQQAGGRDKIRAQKLPKFQPTEPNADRLFGLDLISKPGSVRKEDNRRTFHGGFEVFDAKKHVRGDERSGGRQTPGAVERQDDRKRRGDQQ